MDLSTRLRDMMAWGLIFKIGARLDRTEAGKGLRGAERGQPQGHERLDRTGTVPPMDSGSGAGAGCG